ncbi:TPA: hypothetical protein HA251_08130 [Candidatus Woesearchaeota archaeon]|nr:hypothetical protein [Candidatus Woesearchaeota archaeon]
MDRAQLSAVTCTLEVEGITKQTVWERVGKGNDWSDLRAKFAKAKSSSKPLIDEYRQQILCCIVARQQ